VSCQGLERSSTTTDPTTRRGYLGLLAGGTVAGLAGCADPGTGASGEDAPSPGSDTAPTGTAPTSTAGEPVPGLVPVAPGELRSTGRVSVLQDVRIFDEASDLEGDYDLEVDAGTRYGELRRKPRRSGRG